MLTCHTADRTDKKKKSDSDNVRSHDSTRPERTPPTVMWNGTLNSNAQHFYICTDTRTPAHTCMCFFD